MIRFEEITNKNIWKVCSLEVYEEQKDYVADNMLSLAEAFATRNEGNNALPFAIYNDQTLVGFVMIGKGTVGNTNESDLIKNKYSLWRLMIDKKFQGQGLGLESLIKVIEYVKTWPLGKAKYIWTSYEKENTRGKRIYSKFGFKETGEMCDNEIVAIYKL